MVIIAILFVLVFSNRSVAEQGVNTIRLEKMCSSDDENHPLSYPTTVVYDAGRDEVILTDAGNGQLVFYNSDLFPVASLGKGRGLQAITSCFPHKNGLYVVCSNAQGKKGYIARVNPAFIVEEIIYLNEINPQLGEFTARQIVAGIDNRFYILAFEAGEIFVFDQNWHFLHKLVPRDETLGVSEPAPIQAMACDEQGDLYFLSEERGRVYVYDRKESYQYKFGEKGGAERKLARPRGLAVDRKNNRILIVDYLRHALSAYTLKGDYLFEIGGKGTRPGWFLYPTDVCVNAQGDLFIADTFNHRIQQFSISASPKVE